MPTLCASVSGTILTVRDGKPYGAGTSDFTKLVALASAGKSWVTAICWICITVISGHPGKQFPPKEWAYADANALEKYVYDYTKDVLLKLKRLDLASGDGTGR